MTATAPAKVYFTNLRTHARESQLDKLKRLIRHAGIEQIDFENKFVAIKIHFGELGNLSFLRPNYARAVADVVKELGGKPFLTDCNTLYVGGRANALDHLDSAMLNGYSPMTTGAQCIIADGLKGGDYDLVPIRGGTDGARLSFMGLPCPNLFTGGMNFHGKFEYCSLTTMRKAQQVILNLAVLRSE